MKKTSRVTALLLTLTAMLLLLCACGEPAAKNVPVSELCDKVASAVAAIAKADMQDPGENYVKGYMKKDASEIGEYVIRKNVMGTSLDEFGIFKAGAMTTDELKDMISAYLEILKASQMGYFPEEEPKLEASEIKVCGDYVMYCILGDADKEAAFNAFADALK